MIAAAAAYLICLGKSLTDQHYRRLSDATRWGAGQCASYRWLETAQWWSRDQLAAYQWERITELLRSAYAHTVFYRRRFDELGAAPEDIRSFDDYRRLPLLTKSEVRRHRRELTSDQFSPSSLIETRTGGSTGAPLVVYKSPLAEQVRVAVSWRSRAWAGIDFRARRCLIEIHHAAERGQRGWYIDPRSRTLLLSAGRLDNDRLRRYAEICRLFKPEMLIGSIGFVRVLGRFLEEQREARPPFRGIFVVGETVSPIDRVNVQRQFGCELFDAYGMRENAVSACECAAHSLHINSEFTYVEFEKGDHGGIIGTNLHNLAFPLIRYQTEDMGRLADGGCECGRAHPRMTIEGGRTRDYLRTREGYVFVSWHLAQFIDKNMGVEKLQLYQPDLDHVVVRIVRGDTFSERDKNALLDSLRQLAGDLLTFSDEYVDEIERTPLGKHLFVKSDLAEESDALRG